MNEEPKTGVNKVVVDQHMKTFITIYDKAFNHMLTFRALEKAHARSAKREKMLKEQLAATLEYLEAMLDEKVTLAVKAIHTRIRDEWYPKKLTPEERAELVAKVEAGFAKRKAREEARRTA